jgi:Cys-rich protein (TIGR01571 family)
MSTPARIIQADEVNHGDRRKAKNYPPAMLPPSNQMVEVTAPSALMGGYTFDAVHDGQVFTVTIPEGGVKAGETFLVPFHPDQDNIMIVNAEPVLPSNAPSEVTPMLPPLHSQQPQQMMLVWTGAWKDGLCDCCSNGCCHPSLLNAWCFPQILMGQVLTRMKMTWCGQPAQSRRQYKQTFHILLWLTVVYWVIWMFFHCDDENEHHNPNCHGATRHVMGTVNFVWFLYTVIVMIKLRRAVRDRYKIPQNTCHGCEDCCCVVFCTCCTISQLSRQTANYQSQRAYCCSDTGLPEEQYALPEALVV